MSKNERYDIVIVGAGHNGTTAAAYLALIFCPHPVGDVWPEVTAFAAEFEDNYGTETTPAVLLGIVLPELMTEILKQAGTAMPRQRYNQLLRELLDEINESDGIANYRVRLMIVGGVLDDPAYVKVIEDRGGLVVTDSLCFGSRILWKDVDEGAGDPITALARYQIQERPPCPRMFGTHLERLDYVMDMIREFNVDGVISERLIFCDMWTGEQFILGKELKRKGIPFLALDREYTLSSIGQLRTRVQAFVESIKGGR